jgi:hypothetical protein
MEKLYKEINEFIIEIQSETSTADARQTAIRAHQSIDLVVKKLQILKEYIELLEEEYVYFQEENIPFEEVKKREFFRDFLGKILAVETNLYRTQFNSDSQAIDNFSTLTDEVHKHVERLCTLGDDLRKTHIFQENIGG